MSESVTPGPLGGIPATTNVYTAAQTVALIDAAMSVVSGVTESGWKTISDILSGAENVAERDYVDGLIRMESGTADMVEIGSGYDSLSGLAFNCYGSRVKVLLETDIRSGLSGLDNDMACIEGLVLQARSCYGSGIISDYDLAMHVAMQAASGFALYDAIESDGPYCGTDSGLKRAALATNACWELFGVSGVNVGTLKQFLLDVESSGSVCNLISGCMSGTVSGIMEDISGLQNCCSSVGDLNAAMTSLNSAVASLQSATCGISATLSGMADAISGLPDAIVEAIDSSPLLTEEVKAKAKAAVLPAVHDMNQTLNQKKNDLAEDLAAMADALDDNDPTAIDSVSEALSEVADAAESASMSDAAESASSGADEASSASSSAANESTVIEALPGFVP